MDKSKYLKLFEDCKLIKGYKRSIICDLSRENYTFIPNSLYNLIKKFNGSIISEIFDYYEQKNTEILNDYFRFLITNEFIFLCNKEELNYFPEMSDYWDYPGEISNAIIDINKNSKHNYNSIFNQLDLLGCKNIQLRFYSEYSIDILDKILNFTFNKRIKSIEIFFQFSTKNSLKNYTRLIERHKRISKIIIHSTTNSFEDNQNKKLLFFNKKINSQDQCGYINKESFSCNIETYSESKKYNSCLNRKIGIDENGNIKNCPSMNKSYGNIKNSALNDAINKSGFKDVWFIHKDKIEVCKDCEFRHVCSDCRAFLKNSKNFFSQPLKCKYNPYIAKWEGEDGWTPIDETKR